MDNQGDPWLPPSFEHAERVELPTGHHLRPIRETDTDIDFPAVMGSRDSLWATFGPAWGWPPEAMTYEHDRADLARHEREAREHKSFNYAMFDADESHLLGCIYIDPPERVGADADISWWVVDDELGGALDTALTEFVPRWIADAWPFVRPRLVGRDLSWAEWLSLPEVDAEQ
jgi:RimJ/RimL family protein N-acetyltransferase